MRYRVSVRLEITPDKGESASDVRTFILDVAERLRDGRYAMSAGDPDARPLKVDLLVDVDAESVTDAARQTEHTLLGVIAEATSRLPITSSGRLSVPNEWPAWIKQTASRVHVDIDDPALA